MRIFLAMMAAFLLGCGPANFDRARSGPAQPSWLPIGPEIYQERDVSEVEQKVLAIRQEPRWFQGFARQVTKQEFDQYIELERQHPSVKVSHQMGSANGRYWLPSPPPYPKRLEDLPLEDEGVSVEVELAPDADPAVVQLNLKLNSRDKPVLREVQHRWTNTLPFLFGFYVDRQAVVVPKRGSQMLGGMASMAAVANAGRSRNWRVRMASQSLLDLLPDLKPHEIAIVAVFCNSQHDGQIGEDAIRPWKQPTNGAEPPSVVLVRSRAATLRWDGAAWRADAENVEGRR